MKQKDLAISPIKIQEINSISMGILPNNEKFLFLQGLVKFCGMASSSTIQLTQDWEKGETQSRNQGQQPEELILTSGLALLRVLHDKGC